MKKNSINRVKKLHVLYEDNHLIVINKPAGVLVQGDKTGDAPISDTVKDYLKHKYKKPGEVFLGTVHRLDRPVSGVLLFAKTSKALARMNELFKTKNIQKTYWAIVEGIPVSNQGRLEHFLIKNQQKNKSKAFHKEVANSKKAVLNYKLLREGENFSLLEIELETGRHHQIRSQLSAIGHCIKGDLKYGSKRSNADGSIALHAVSLDFIHPVKKEQLKIMCPPNHNDLWGKLCTGAVMEVFSRS